MSMDVIDEVLSVLITEKMMKPLNIQEQSFGITIKMLVFRARLAEPRMSHAIFAILLSLVAVLLEL